MLKQLQRFFTTQVDTTAQATQEEVGMTETEKATFAAAENKAAELSVALEAANTAFAEKETALAEMTAKYEVVQAALNTSAEAQATLIAQATEKRLVARTEAITAAVGTDKVEALLAATDAMGDEQFNVIVSAMAASFDVEAKTPAFKEAGVTKELVVDEKPTHFNQFIKKEGK